MMRKFSKILLHLVDTIFLKLFPGIFSLLFLPSLNAQNNLYPEVPGVVINHQPASSRQYIGSPSIAILPNGNYVTSHDLFGPESLEHISATTLIFRSEDRGRNWAKISEIHGAFWSSLFVHRGNLYLIGPDRHNGSVLIRRSTDGGETWTQPANTDSGLLLKGMFHCAPTPVIEHNDRLWRAMETSFGINLPWGRRFGAMMMSAPVDADLMNADSWTVSNLLPYDSTYLDGNFIGWLEGNAVVAPDGEIVNILRVDEKSTFDEKAAIVKISSDGKKAVFDPETGFVSFPGGSKKFTIRYDDKSARYWTLSNAIPKKFIPNFPELRALNFRNTLVLMSSEDLLHWHIHEIVLQHPDVLHSGFHYVDWLVDGDDMIVASRTAYFDGKEKANNNHDTNFLTFHRIENFREKAKNKVDFVF